MADEKWDVYDAPDDAPLPETRAAAGEPLPSAIQELGARRTKRPPALVGALIGLALLVGVLFGIIHSRGADHTATSPSTGEDKALAYRQGLVTADINAFVAALKKRADSTVVEEFTAFDTFYEAVVPPSKGDLKPRQYTWRPDSGLRDSGDAADLGPRQTFDLAALDLPPLQQLFDKAWHAVPDSVTGWSFSVQPPTAPGKSWIRLFLHVPGSAFYAVDGDLDGAIVNEREVDGS